MYNIYILILQDYLEKNNLYMDKENNLIKKVPKGPVYTSRIIHNID